MKIGVFGDSFCAGTVVDYLGPSWVDMLENYGHNITNFGAGGSSMLFSAQLIESRAKDFDFIIWAATFPPRISIKIDEPPYHLHFSAPKFNFQDGNYNLTLPESRLKAKAASDYYTYLMDFDEYCLIGRSLVNYFLNTYDNLLIIPCFHDPIGKNFNLYELCERESKQYFPDTELHIVYKDYVDLRNCHLTLNNNKILADLIANNLKHGIFQTEYSNFTTPSESKETYFQLKR